MRFQKRGGAPAILQTHGAKWTALWVKRRQAYQADPHKKAPSFAWPTTDGTTVNVRLIPLLKAQTQDHCSFCDSYPVEPPGKDTIEHFKPKTTFSEDAFAWENLFFCCPCCQDAKKENYDALLLKPDAGGYAFDDWFLADLTNGEMQPHPKLAGEKLERAKKTIKLYGLDSEEQRSARRLWIHHYGPQLNLGDRNSDVVPYREWLAQLP